jgi:hypothetical protein
VVWGFEGMGIIGRVFAGQTISQSFIFFPQFKTRKQGGFSMEHPVRNYFVARLIATLLCVTKNRVAKSVAHIAATLFCVTKVCVTHLHISLMDRNFETPKCSGLLNAGVIKLIRKADERSTKVAFCQKPKEEAGGRRQKAGGRR